MLEATHSNRNTPAGGTSWVQITADSPDGVAMQTQPNSGRNVFANVSQSPLLEYKVSFVTNGTHYIWVLGEGDSSPGAGNDDTCNIGLDGVLPDSGTGVGGTFAVASGFLWNNAIGNTAIATLNVADPGDLTVDVWMQKDGLSINKVVLTTDPDYDPNSTPPTESPLNPAAPVMSMQTSSNGLVIAWSGGGMLYSAPAVTGPWDPVPGASSSINIYPTVLRQFYRVIR